MDTGEARLGSSRILQAEKRGEPFPVEPDHDLAINDRHRRGGEAQALELFHRGRILGDIFRLERNAVLGEELLDPATEDSAGLIEHRDRPGHRIYLLCGQIQDGPIRRHRARCSHRSAVRLRAAVMSVLTRGSATR